MTSTDPDHMIPLQYPAAQIKDMSHGGLFVASLGNAGARYARTRHSAGHLLLNAMAVSSKYPAFSRSREHAGGLVSRGNDAVLWQSPTLMNISGPAVAAAWKTHRRTVLPGTRQALVVLHDDLESPFGKIRVKRGGSAKGHNGIRSCIHALGGMDFWRVLVGIGRPHEGGRRVQIDISDYVLGRLSETEIQIIESRAEMTWAELAKIN